MALDQFVLDNFTQASSQACLTDLTAPTFSGITGLVAQVNGSLLASWGAATDATTPVRFNVYVQATTATGLFNTANIAATTYGSQVYLFQLADNTLLAKDVVYFVGVRAVDAVGNENNNTVSLSATSAGVLDDDFASLLSDLLAVAADVAVDKSQCKGVFAITNTNELSGRLWFEFKGQAVSSLLGTASYQVYDSSDNAIVGLSQSGITANGNGVFLITPVDASALDPFVSYRVRITITYDSVAYTSFKGFTVGE